MKKIFFCLLSMCCMPVALAYSYDLSERIKNSSVVVIARADESLDIKHELFKKATSLQILASSDEKLKMRSHISIYHESRFSHLPIHCCNKGAVYLFFLKKSVNGYFYSSVFNHGAYQISEEKSAMYINNEERVIGQDIAELWVFLHSITPKNKLIKESIPIVKGKDIDIRYY